MGWRLELVCWLQNHYALKELDMESRALEGETGVMRSDQHSYQQICSGYLAILGDYAFKAAEAETEAGLKVSEPFSYLVLLFIFWVSVMVV